MLTCAIVGTGWGDEGKGRMVDLIAEDYDIVCRYQGGNNAGHTVINELGEFKLNLLPSGIFRVNAVNVLGAGTVLDLEHLYNEISRLKAAGVKITADNLKISDKAVVCFPFHRDQDVFEEERLAKNQYGSTRRGIAPVYGDKYAKKAVKMYELLDEEYLLSHIEDILSWKNLVIKGVYNREEYTLEKMAEWIRKYGYPLREHICDTTELFRKAQQEGKSVLFEGQLGALRDIDYGIYPYTTSSNTLASYAPVGSGAPFLKVDKVVGITKAYSTCVGAGPFVSEWDDEEGEKLRKVGAEYGAATGRPRRVGPLDLVAIKYGALLQGTTELALTKLDVLSYMEEIPVCVGYSYQGQVNTHFPNTPYLYQAEPIYISFPGWKCDISKITSYDKLPSEAKQYIEYIENYLEVPIKYISVGPERNEIIIR